MDTTQQQASSCAAGGAILPYNPAWAPFPVHAWPDAGTKPCEQMQAHATYIQQENAQAVTQLEAQVRPLRAPVKSPPRVLTDPRRARSLLAD